MWSAEYCTGTKKLIPGLPCCLPFVIINSQPTVTSLYKSLPANYSFTEQIFFTSSFRRDSPVTNILSTVSYCTNMEVGPERKKYRTSPCCA